MTDPAPASDADASAVRLRTPGWVFWMLFSAPVLIAAGAFITVAMRPFVSDVSAKGDAVLMAWIGAILLCLGVAFLIAGIALAGVRSIMEQQTELLRGTLPRRHGE